MADVLDVPEVRRAAVRLTPDQYHQLSEMGVISERTELLSGIVVRKMTKSPLHTWMVTFLQNWLASIVGEGMQVRKEDPLTLHDSEPEPDLSVVMGTADAFRSQHPSTAKLVIEVAIHSEGVDRQKAEIYAAADVDEYWIVLPNSKSIEVYRRSLNGRYQSRETYEQNATVAPLCSPDSPLPIRELFAN